MCADTYSMIIAVIAGASLSAFFVAQNGAEPVGEVRCGPDEVRRGGECAARQDTVDAPTGSEPAEADEPARTIHVTGDVHVVVPDGWDVSGMYYASVVDALTVTTYPDEYAEYESAEVSVSESPLRGEDLAEHAARMENTVSVLTGLTGGLARLNAAESGPVSMPDVDAHYIILRVYSDPALGLPVSGNIDHYILMLLDGNSVHYVSYGGSPEAVAARIDAIREAVGHLPVPGL